MRCHFQPESSTALTCLSGGTNRCVGATLDGALVLQMLGKKNGTGAPCFVRYAADGTWEGLDLKLPDQNDTPSFSTLASDGACLSLFAQLRQERRQRGRVPSRPRDPRLREGGKAVHRPHSASRGVRQRLVRGVGRHFLEAPRGILVPNC